jgi:hypothetical protein
MINFNFLKFLNKFDLPINLQLIMNSLSVIFISILSTLIFHDLILIISVQTVLNLGIFTLKMFKEIRDSKRLQKYFANNF